MRTRVGIVLRIVGWLGSRSEHYCGRSASFSPGFGAKSELSDSWACLQWLDWTFASVRHEYADSASNHRQLMINKMIRSSLSFSILITLWPLLVYSRSYRLA